MALDTTAANIKKKIAECLSVISMTTIADVKGERVMPVKKAVIPTTISKLALLPVNSNKPDVTAPILAPILKDGANMPPAPPMLNELIKPPIRTKGMYQATVLSPVNKVRSMISLPEPIASVPSK